METRKTASLALGLGLAALVEYYYMEYYLSLKSFGDIIYMNDSLLVFNYIHISSGSHISSSNQMEICMEYDWDLQAALVGLGDGTAGHQLDPFGFGLDEHQPLLIYDSPEGTSADFEGPYKSFHPVFSQTIVTDSMTSAPQDPEKLNTLQSLAHHQPPPAKPKKIRKNQQKRVVQHVSEDGLQSDTWAWRKYGQKPIKGSPYPRSYYRCSSSKGCLARKQVERTCSDPTTFIITYTAEHSHSEPTRRSSLAGSKRSKAGKANFVTLERQSSTETPADLAMEVQEMKKQGGILEGGGQKIEEAIMSKELVASLEDLEALLMDQTFLDVSPECWPILDFAALIDGNT